MSQQALFAKVLADLPDIAAEAAKVAVAADLTVMLAKSGLSRVELAKRLNWSRARVTQVLSGEGNLTIETVFAVAQALGQTFDIVFRKPDERRLPQAWERGAMMSLAGGCKVNELNVGGRYSKPKVPSAEAWAQPARRQAVIHDSLKSAAQAMEWAHAA